MPTLIMKRKIFNNKKVLAVMISDNSYAILPVARGFPHYLFDKAAHRGGKVQVRKDVVYVA